MNREDVDYGQRSRVDLPGVGDHGQVGTVTRVRGNLCSIHRDRDAHPHRVVVLYARDREQIGDEPLDAVPAWGDPTASTGRATSGIARTSMAASQAAPWASTRAARSGAALATLYWRRGASWCSTGRPFRITTRTLVVLSPKNGNVPSRMRHVARTATGPAARTCSRRGSSRSVNQGPQHAEPDS